MRITLESDYALRILSALAQCNELVDAKTLSELIYVTPRFTLKILRKLAQGNLVSSRKGVNGGYMLKMPPDKISLKLVIELIDGPIAMVRCLNSSEECSMLKDKTNCIYHKIFDTISLDVARKLSAITIADVLDNKPNLLLEGTKC